METKEMKLEIEEQISIIELAFDNYWARFISRDLLKDDISVLEITFKKISRLYKYQYLVSMVLIAFMFVASLLVIGGVVFKDTTPYKFGLLIICIMPILVNTFRYYKIKVNLGYKIYLLKLLERIN